MAFDPNKFLSKEAIIKLSKGYSPCPAPVIDIIKTLVKPAEKGCLLDNCAGTGEAAIALASEWGLNPYLIEPHFGRFIVCAASEPNSFCAPANQVVLSGIPTLWFFNPPFNPADKTGPLEKSIFKASLNYAVGTGTLCIILLPFRALHDKYFQRQINLLLTNIVIRAFPGIFFDKYQQVVLFGYGRSDKVPRRISPFCKAPPPELIAEEFLLQLTPGLSSFLTFSLIKTHNK